jgi:DNA-binding NtrC family response regulator
MPGDSRSILVIDDDLDIARLVEAVLTDEGYRVAHLHDVTPEVVVRTVGMLEPDCVLLDGESALGYGSSWELAAALAVRDRPVPVVMFTAHSGDLQEATADTSDRSRAARFSGILRKPFDLDELLEVVTRAVSYATLFDRSREADAERMRQLVHRLETAARPTSSRVRCGNGRCSGHLPGASRRSIGGRQ